MPPPAYLAASFATVAAIAACGRREAPVVGEPVRDAAPPPVDGRIYTEADAVDAQYRSVAEIAADRAQAKGKLAVVRIRRGAVWRDSVEGYPCEEKAWPIQKFFLVVAPWRVDAVRGMPERLDAECPRVLLRVNSIGSTGFTGYRADDGSWQSRNDETQVVTATALAVFDVPPRAKTPPPAGADYATLLDVQLGPEDGGAVATVRLQRRHESYRPLFLHLYPCDPDDRRDGVLFRDEPLDGPLATIEGCQSITFRTRSRGTPDYGTTIDAELIRIGP